MPVILVVVFVVPCKPRPRSSSNSNGGKLTNRKWFCVVCTLINKDIRHHSGQNVVDSRGALTRLHKREKLACVWRVRWSLISDLCGVCKLNCAGLGLMAVFMLETLKSSRRI